MFRQTTSWSGLSDGIYITKRMKWPGVNSPYIFFHVIFIQMKLSSKLCLTHKRVTEVYKFYIDLKKKKKKKNCAGIGSDLADTQNFLDRIGSEKMVSLHP